MLFQHASSLYEDQYTPIIVNSLDTTTYPHQLNAFQSQHPQQTTTPVLYYNSTGPIPSMVDANIDAKIHCLHQHLKSSLNTSQTLPRRCSVGPIEGPAQTMINDGLGLPFTKAPKSVAQSKSNCSGSTVRKSQQGQQQSINLAFELSDNCGPLDSLPLLGSSECGGSNSTINTTTNIDQVNSGSNLKPHEICLVSIQTYAKRL